jgi:hypothetical protein
MMKHCPKKQRRFWTAIGGQIDDVACSWRHEGVNAGTNEIPFCHDINLNQEPRRSMKRREEATGHKKIQKERPIKKDL